VSESKVVLNLDGISNLEARYPSAIIQKYEGGRSKAKYFMADTVHMIRRKGMTREAMVRIAKDAAPLAEKIVIDGLPDNPSHDNKAGIFPAHTFAVRPVYVTM